MTVSGTRATCTEEPDWRRQEEWEGEREWRRKRDVRRNRHSNRETTHHFETNQRALRCCCCWLLTTGLREREIDDRVTKGVKGREGERTREQSRIDRVARGWSNHRPTSWSACLPCEPDKKRSVPKDTKREIKKEREGGGGAINVRKNEGEGLIENATHSEKILVRWSFSSTLYIL